VRTVNKTEVDYPVPSMDEFLKHLFPQWFTHYEVGGRIRVVLRHPTRYIGTEASFTTDDLYRAFHEETISQDKLATSKLINAITVRLLTKYLEILNERKYEEVPLVSEWLRCQIMGSEFIEKGEKDE